VIVRIEPMAIGLRVRLTGDFVTSLLILAVVVSLFVWFGLPWGLGALMMLVGSAAMYGLGRDGIEQWLGEVTRRKAE
jgi:hypothetical protein